MPYTYLSPEDKLYKKNTADKAASLCLFYNLALDRINELITVYENKEVCIEKLNYSEPNQLHFKKETYLQLKVYLWKEQVSGSFAQILQSDIRIINFFLYKLVDVRNFQSHYYHDAEALRFPSELVDFITHMFEKAKNQLSAMQEDFDIYLKQLENDVTQFKKKEGDEFVEKTDTYRHFDFFDVSGCIKEEGKNFFLSFFLLKGEMNKFLKKRKRCKKDNGEKYQVKTRLYIYYCHRDGSNRFFLNAKKSYLLPKEQLRRQHNTILNYLKTQPIAHYKYIPATKEMPLYSREEIEQRKEDKGNESLREKEEHEVIRRKDKFLSIAIRYFMDRNAVLEKDDPTIYWHTESLLPEQTVKQNVLVSKDDFKSSYFKKLPHWQNKYEAGFFPVYTNRHIKFKLNKEDTVEYAIGEREIKNWLYYLLSSTERKTMAQTIEAINKYGEQYQVAFNELSQTNTISFERYPLVFEKGIDSVVLSEMYKKILNSKSFNLEEYRTKIEKAINGEIKLLIQHIEQKQEYTRNKKNRIILKCFNWFLPVEAKLKPDEVNKLSIYNFVAENRNLKESIRKSIIREIEPKLQRAQHGAFAIVQNTASLDDLFDSMITLQVDYLTGEHKNLPEKSEIELHDLARKLSVSLPGIDCSRTAGKNRLDELKHTIARKPILITNGLFKRAFTLQNNSDTISGKILKNKLLCSLLIPEQYTLTKQDKYINKEKNALQDIPTEVLQVVNDNYDTFFKEHTLTEDKGFMELVNKFLPLLEDNQGANTKQVKNALNLYRKLREVQVHDALLAQVLFQYHNSTLAGLESKERVYTNINQLYDAKYLLNIGSYQIELEYKQLDDLSTKWNRKKINRLFKNNKYWNENLLLVLDEKSFKSPQQKILILMDKVWEDSYYYIDTFLTVEKKVINNARDMNKLQYLLSQSKAIQAQKRMVQGMHRIEPQVILEEYNGLSFREIESFTDIRSHAFHADIPPNNIKYETEKDKLMVIARIQKREKRDKSSYRK